MEPRPSKTPPPAPSERVAIVGLGYVGLPLALALDRRFGGTIAFDTSDTRIRQLVGRLDVTGEADRESLEASTLSFTSDPEALRSATFIIVAVPTPIDANRQPDLGPLAAACEAVGAHLSRGAVVVFESTVYPGITEEFCRPKLAEASGLRPSIDFFVGYSPERINPGDREHRLENITKIVAGEDERTLTRIADVYSEIVEAGIYRAHSIRTAEAAKVIENTQRDLNIALVNELAIIFDRLNLRTVEVLQAAGTKWNFLPFRPGLVGGHCIGVDPYYLTAKAEQLGYHPQVILAGRRINDGMGAFIAQKVVKLLANADRPLKGARVGILGITFKENVADIRNSRVPDIVRELEEYGITARVHDPIADHARTKAEYAIDLVAWDDLADLDAMVLAVPHVQYLEKGETGLLAPLAPSGVLVDVKSAVSPEAVPSRMTYWSL